MSERTNVRESKKTKCEFCIHWNITRNSGNTQICTNLKSKDTCGMRTLPTDYCNDFEFSFLHCMGRVRSGDKLSVDAIFSELSKEYTKILSSNNILKRDNKELRERLSCFLSQSKKELVIRLKKEPECKHGIWIADTNLPGSPPIARNDSWENAVGELIHRLQLFDFECYRETHHIPKWEVKYPLSESEFDGNKED